MTACQGDGVKDAGAASSNASASDDATAKDSGSAGKDSGSAGSDAQGGSTGSSSASTGGDGKRSGQGGDSGAGTQNKDGAVDSPDAKRTTCDLGTTRVRLQETGGSAPVILLKATNTGSTRCDLYGHPFLGYPDAQSPVQVGGGPPQAVVSLEPGKSAYASLSLEKGSGNNMHREKELTVELADSKQHGTGSTASLTAPGAGLALSDASTVSYWNTTPEQTM
ncbi:hypothetical protein B1H18_31340 [Streptomyces tsukubensis]|uniref:DUF4232 domain-containing protein n=2 Tax=Streptomyces tsukubensis TaxID=83656 RepID=A0A1V4A066_9ACTN|nr:hypothetical protein B1H18_31340 [Streptomyces tsukubensis]